MIQVCEHYVSHGLCTDYPDWSIAAAGSESLVKIGFEYGRSIIGEELMVDLDHYENDQTAVDPQEEGALVTSSNGLLEELGLDAYDLEGEEVDPSSSTPGPSSSTPGPSSSTPGPSSSTPGPSSSTPGPSSSTPGPSSSTPGPSSSTPSPSRSGLSAPSSVTPTTPTSGKFNH